MPNDFRGEFGAYGQFISEYATTGNSLLRIYGYRKSQGSTYFWRDCYICDGAWDMKESAP